jgi:hypothetical protein
MAFLFPEWNNIAGTPCYNLYLGFPNSWELSADNARP